MMRVAIIGVMLITVTHKIQPYGLIVICALAAGLWPSEDD